MFEYIQLFQGYVSAGILAVFIYGLVNRSGGEWAGVIGLIANPILYGFMSTKFPDMHFLWWMSYSLIGVLVILFIYGFIHKRAEKVVFATNTTMDLTTSRPALMWGLVVCAATVLLYVVLLALLATVSTVVVPSLVFAEVSDLVTNLGDIVNQGRRKNGT